MSTRSLSCARDRLIVKSVSRKLLIYYSEKMERGTGRGRGRGEKKEKAAAVAVPVITGVGHGVVNVYVGKVAALAVVPNHFDEVTIAAKIVAEVPHKLSDVALDPVFEK